MFWAVWAVLLALLFAITKKSDNGIAFLIALYFGIFGLFVGFTSLPKIYKLRPDGTVKKEFAALPWIKRAVAGETFRPHLDSTYILNPSGSPLLVGKVLYTDNVCLVGQPVLLYNVKADTVRKKLLRYSTKHVAPFQEASTTLETTQIRGIEMITVLAIPNQRLESLNEKRYRPLKEAEEYVDSGLY